MAIHVPSIMLTIKSYIIFAARNPSPRENTPSWYPFLEPHQITYHSNIVPNKEKVTWMHVALCVYLSTYA